MLATGYGDTAEHLVRLARLAPADGHGDANGSAEAVATVPIPGGTIEILASDELDLGAAERRRQDRRAKLEAEIERCRRKLANDGFVAKAPAAVVQEERDKLARLESELELL